MNWNLLLAFEAVARHGNFSRAAAELNVQQPAISRRVAALEADIGTRLISRTRPVAILTVEGEILFRGLTEGLDHVRGALARIQQTGDGERVIVNTTIGFASCYLMKRLSVFRKDHPSTTIELVSRDQNAVYNTVLADIVTSFDDPANLPGVRQARIFSETLVAVATPDMARAIDDDPSVLARQKLLHLTHGIHARDWFTFFEGTAVTPRAPSAADRFMSFMVYLHAGLNGDGVIPGWDKLMQDYMDLGQLVPVSSRRVTTNRGYFACLMAPAQSNRQTLEFWNWLGRLDSPETHEHPGANPGEMNPFHQDSL